MIRRLLPPIMAGLGAILTSAATIAPASAYDALYAFGDSLSDAGNAYALTLHLEPISPPYAQGRFTNGKIWLQDLAATLSLPRVRPELLGGTDFAVGGAETGTTAVHTANFTDLPAQFAAFTAKTPTPRANALYAVWIGSNDLLDILADAKLNSAPARGRCPPSDCKHRDLHRRDRRRRGEPCRGARRARPRQNAADFANSGRRRNRRPVRWRPISIACSPQT